MIHVLKERFSENFLRLRRETRVLESFFNKITGCRPATLDTLAHVFSCEFCEIFQSSLNGCETLLNGCFCNKQVPSENKLTEAVNAKEKGKLNARTIYVFSMNSVTPEALAAARRCSIQKLFLKVSQNS